MKVFRNEGFEYQLYDDCLISIDGIEFIMRRVGLNGVYLPTKERYYIKGKSLFIGKDKVAELDINSEQEIVDEFFVD